MAIVLIFDGTICVNIQVMNYLINSVLSKIPEWWNKHPSIVAVLCIVKYRRGQKHTDPSWCLCNSMMVWIKVSPEHSPLHITHRHRTPALHCRWGGPWRRPVQGSMGCNRAPLSLSLLLVGRSIPSEGWTRNPLRRVWGGKKKNKNRKEELTDVSGF